MNDPKKDASAGEVANVFPERSGSDRSAGGHTETSVPPLVDFVADYDEKNGTKAADLNVENFPSDIGFGESNDERAQYIAAVRFLKEKAEEETGVFSETIPRYKARKALASIGLG